MAGRRGTAAVIVNYRTKDLTLAAARSALAQPDVEELVIVDNASGDDSAAFLRDALAAAAAKVTVVESSANGGFARGANLGAHHALAPLLLFLNSDAQLQDGALSCLVDRLLESETTAIVAPAAYGPDGEPQRDAFGRFPKLSIVRGGAPESDSRLPDWVSALAMVVRREDFSAIGGFDSDYEMYMEDVDLCRRFRLQGRVVRREPAAAVRHLGGGSWSSSVEQRIRFQASKITYFRKAGATSWQLAYLHAVKAARVLLARGAAAWRGWARTPLWAGRQSH